jgi:DNA-binding XRE family transcriptional regulator
MKSGGFNDRRELIKVTKLAGGSNYLELFTVEAWIKLLFVLNNIQYISYLYYFILNLAIILTIMNNFYIDKNPIDLLKELSVKTRKLRKERKLSQEEIARKANMSLGSYKRFENSGQISLESLLKIAFVLERLDDFEFIFRTEEQKPSEKLFN